MSAAASSASDNQDDAKASWEARVGPHAVRVAIHDLPAKVIHASIGAAGDIIMALVGGTGCGKTSQLQHMCNVLMGVQGTEAFIQYVPIRHSVQSDTPRSYFITVEISDASTQRVDRRYLIVDTPGLGDTRGRMADVEHTTDILQAILRLHHLNAVLFLASASESRYTAHQEYCIQSILSFFPATFKQRIGLVLTNSVGEPNFKHEQTPLHHWKPRVFLVNNAVKAEYTTEDGAAVARQCWPATRAKVEAVLSWVQEQPAAQVTKFADIQQRRERIAVTIDNTLEEISRLSQLKQEITIADKKIGSLEDGKHSAGPLRRRVRHRVYKNVPCGYWSTWCRQHPINEQNRRQACHERCQLDYSPDGGNVFKGCAAMQGADNCGSCLCGWQVHFHSNTTWLAEDVEREEVDGVVESRLRELAELITAEEAGRLHRLSLVQKMEALVDVNMRRLVQAAGELVTLCNGFNLAQDLSCQIQGLQMRIDCSLDLPLRRKLEETRDALTELQRMAATTAQQSSASDPDAQQRGSDSREGRARGHGGRAVVSSGLHGPSESLSGHRNTVVDAAGDASEQSSAAAENDEKSAAAAGDSQGDAAEADCEMVSRQA